MKCFIKQKRTRFLTLFIAIITGSILMAGCSTLAVESNRSSNKNATETQNNSAENNSAETKKTLESAPANQTEDLPEFKKGEDYKNSVRSKMLKAGWEPFHSENAQLCGSGDSTCDEFPEMEACAGTGLGNCKFLWKKGEKLVAIFTVGEPFIYDSFEFEKSSNQAKQSDLLGKYNYHYTEDYGGDVFVELQSDNAVIYQASSEDSNTEGQGSWNWDETKKLLTVTLPSVKFKMAGGDAEDSKTYKQIMIFKKDGKNLKIVKAEPTGIIKTGTVFSKL